jgi:glycosyltransferase involved in cell wall biosynthesis
VSRVAILTGEVVGPRLAGPAIRALAMAAALAEEHEVTVLAAAVEGASPGPFRLEALADASCARVASGDVLVVQGDLLDRFPVLTAPGPCVVADLYDPYHLEVLEASAGLAPDRRRATVAASVGAIGTLLARGDVFLGAGGLQRDLWIGALAAAGRVNEFTYGDAPDLSRLLLDVPFGIEPTPPAPSARPVLRGVEPGIGVDDVVLWWGGGIHPWFDPTTVIDATAALARGGLPVRLVVAGARHPNPDVGETPAARAAREHVRAIRADEIVRFLDWVPFVDRGAYLLEADVMVSAHLDHVETRYSYRTRLLDGLWAGRPTVATGGDVLMDGIAAAGAGIAVAPGDVDGFAAGVRELVDPDRRRAAGGAATALGARHRWPDVLAPLVEYCRDPRPAPDARVDLTPPAPPSGVRRIAGGVARRLGLR